MPAGNFDALLVTSFGGPERTEDVLPFLENVLRGKPVPRARMLEVAEHYYHFQGRSPINDQNRALLASLRRELARRQLDLRLYWGNRNWHPLLADTVRQMRDDAVGRALVLITSAFGSYSGCRQYQENLATARHAAGEGAPELVKLRLFYNHPAFIQAQADRLTAAWRQLSAAEQPDAALVFTAHSIPLSMAEHSPYRQQLREACGLVAEAAGLGSWQLVYQSRSGSPGQPWLEPDIGDCLEELAGDGRRSAVVVPIGFLSDHMEVLYDLDTEALARAKQLGLRLIRAGTVGNHPRFVEGIGELVAECCDPDRPRLALGSAGPWPAVCPADCCPPPVRPASPAE